MEKIYFEEELQFIKDEGIRNCVTEVLKNVNEEFYRAPASSTGKYHPEYALGEGGLYRHTKAAVKIANDLLQLESICADEKERDYIIAALILHDTCKSGKNWDSKYTMHTHPLQAAELIRDTLSESLFAEDADKIARLVETHMGQWNKAPKWSNVNDRKELPKPENADEFFVHMCDYLASRKYLEVKGVYDNEEVVD
jgi:23S rRNA maturation-related 3'-5' exoribonuclease YhaM